MDYLYSPNALREFLGKHGFRFTKSLGQNFLIEEDVARRTAETVDKTCGVLEIGPGAGALTVQLARTAGHVAAAEIDEHALPILAETTGECDNVEIVHTDAMKLDFRTFCAEHFKGLTPCLCANLPYNITTPILTKAVQAGIFQRMTVMVQKEAGQRLLSRPGEERWGVLPALLAAQYDGKTLINVGRGCFEPPPHVDSMVVVFEKKAHPTVPDALMESYERVVTAAFAQRRKTLSNALAAAGIDPGILVRAGVEPRVRGEALSPETLMRIAALL